MLGYPTVHHRATSGFRPLMTSRGDMICAGAELIHG